ncbi:MAG: hypothetical protein MRZ79_11960 [Bacteroidia bacterium]|nr:hypothetical protein [Bacteroidia bacterium]
MPPKILVAFLSIVFSLSVAHGQKLEWQFSSEKEDSELLDSFTLDSLGSRISDWANGYQILPKFARENPTGYTFLCRLELKGEDKMRIPVWIKVDDSNSYSAPSFPHTYVRFKLLRF